MCKEICVQVTDCEYIFARRNVFVSTRTVCVHRVHHIPTIAVQRDRWFCCCWPFRCLFSFLLHSLGSVKPHYIIFFWYWTKKKKVFFLFTYSIEHSTVVLVWFEFGFCFSFFNVWMIDGTNTQTTTCFVSLLEFYRIIFFLFLSGCLFLFLLFHVSI